MGTSWGVDEVIGRLGGVELMIRIRAEVWESRAVISERYLI